MSATDTLVKEQTPRNQYTANGGQTVFDYDFLILDSADLVVKETKDPGGDNESTTTLTEGAGKDYTVSGVGDESGGSITLNSGADDGDLYTLQRKSPIERITDFLQAGGYRAEDINRQLDEIFLILQELELKIKRGLTSSVESSVEDLVLPDPVAGNLLKWNQNEDGLVNVTISSLSSDTSKYTEAVDFSAGVTKTITHNLDTKDNVVSVRNANEQEISGYTLERPDSNTVDITLSGALSNATVVVIG